jgi:hypothetical protein
VHAFVQAIIVPASGRAQKPRPLKCGPTRRVRPGLRFDLVVFIESTNPSHAHYFKHVMDLQDAPRLKFLHSRVALNNVKLDVFSSFLHGRIDILTLSRPAVR